MATYTQQCSKVGSFSYANNFVLYVILTERDVSINDNTSYVDYNVYCQSSGSGSINSKHLKYFSINGEEKINTTETVNASSPNAYISIASGSIGPIKHNDDGSKTIPFSAQIQGVSYGVSASISNSFTLTTIQRKSQVGLSSSNITLGNQITIYTNSESSNFTHNLYWQVGGGKWYTIATGVTNNYVWNTSSEISSIAAKFTNSKTGNLTINCETYNGSTYLGHTSTTLSFTITSQPIVSSISTSGGINGVFVEDVSNVTTNVTASGIYGSNINSYRVEMYNGSTKIKESYGSSASATFALSGLNLSDDTTITLKATVTDTRGNLGTGSTTIAVKDYFKPQITSRYATRVNSSGTSDSNGTYLYIYWAYSTKSISGVTATTATVKYRRKGASEWIPVTVPNESAIIVGDGGISTDYQYEVQFSVGDGVSNPAVITETIPTGSVTVDYRAGGKGIAFGKVSEKDGFECDMPTNFLQPVNFQNELTWESGYRSDVDYNDVIYTGTYYMLTGCANAPEGRDYLRLLVISNSDSNDLTQMATSVTTGETWIRGCSNGVWHYWSPLVQSYYIPPEANFDDYQKTGVYLCGSAPTHGSAPIDMTGSLEVFKQGVITTQRYTVWNGALIFQRGYYNGNWSDWVKVGQSIMLSVNPSSRKVISGTAWTKINIPLDVVESGYTGGMLSLNSGGIRIGANVNRVKISASFTYYQYDATGEITLSIFKNSSVMSSISQACLEATTVNSLTTSPLLISVSEGDYIYLFVTKNTDQPLTVVPEDGATRLTVEVAG